MKPTPSTAALIASRRYQAPLAHHIAAEMLKTSRTNRRRHSATRAAARRIATAAAIAGAIAAAAIAWTAAGATSAQWRDESTKAAAAYLTHGTPCTLGDLSHAPAELRQAAWNRWSHRPAGLPADPESVAASARVLDYARGYVDHVSDEDIARASLDAVRALKDSGRMDH